MPELTHCQSSPILAQWISIPRGVVLFGLQHVFVGWLQRKVMLSPEVSTSFILIQVDPCPPTMFTGPGSRKPWKL